MAGANCPSVCQSNARRAKVGVLAVEIKTATDAGRVRENNEDALWVGSDCLVVCDGMGGHQAGEVASAIAIQAVSEFPFSGQDPEEEVTSAILQAQERILQASEKNEGYHGMGTTITLAWISSPGENGYSRLTCGHVGDSRCYLFSQGVLEQVTSDHSVVGELLRSGTITPLEARVHPKKHILTQALGSPEIEIELITRDLEPGTLVMLCTDGLSDLVDDTQIADTLGQDFD
ncbi:MAG TPA: hypothetical protein DDW87_10955, partial [Firmicutes bacterium]|nr:hypothetical protein [Bacillota bacterium]